MKLFICASSCACGGQTTFGPPYGTRTGDDAVGAVDDADADADADAAEGRSAAAEKRLSMLSRTVAAMEPLMRCDVHTAQACFTPSVCLL